MWVEVAQHPAIWFLSVFLGIAWLSRVFAAGLNMRKIPDITQADFDVVPVDATGVVPRVSIIVPACNEAEHIELALQSLLQLDYPDYEVIAIDDRSTDATGAIMDRLSDEWQRLPESDSHRLRILHITQLPIWLARQDPRDVESRTAGDRGVDPVHRCRCRLSERTRCGAPSSMPNAKRRITWLYSQRW